MDWYKVTLTKDQIEEDTLLTVKSQFNQYYLRANKPDDMALFVEKIDGGDAKSQIHIFFSPTGCDFCTNIIEGYFGYPCLPPKKNTLELIAGSTKAWELFDSSEYLKIRQNKGDEGNSLFG